MTISETHMANQTGKKVLAKGLEETFISPAFRFIYQLSTEAFQSPSPVLSKYSWYLEQNIQLPAALLQLGAQIQHVHSKKSFISITTATHTLATIIITLQ